MGQRDRKGERGGGGRDRGRGKAKRERKREWERRSGREREREREQEKEMGGGGGGGREGELCVCVQTVPSYTAKLHMYSSIRAIDVYTSRLGTQMSYSFCVCLYIRFMCGVLVLSFRPLFSSSMTTLAT